MEMCSGFGEWATARAKAEQGRYNWIANEIRFDRCHDIWARTLFQGVTNLVTMCGDGRAIAQQCLAAGSVQVQSHACVGSASVSDIAVVLVHDVYCGGLCGA
jgi:tRNA G46 methylase TrmB